ncbi:MAG: polyribonucleotide nucleotidyltransferase [SAR324 cluster bacterium]|nr:polyribonucleotide nucleotidyltransferase [SAR324 cluster bacterium]
MKIVETEFGGRTLSIETGRMAKQANGSVVVRYGDTVVLVAATAAKGTNAGQDFFPLAVFYVEKTYAAGRIPGGFFKREGRLSDRETLISRFIDRPLRPLFHKDFTAETVVQATVLSTDLMNGSDVAAMLGASAALVISDIPFETPIAGVRIGRIEGEFVINPTPDELQKSELDIFMAGSKDAILMVEGEADQVSEDVMVEAILAGHEAIQPVIALQEELIKECGLPKREVVSPEENAELQAKVEKIALPQVQEALQTKDKMERYALMDSIVEKVVEELNSNEEEDQRKEIGEMVGQLKKREMRAKILDEGVRIDGRSLTEIREITCETGVLPRSHGSALFTRGETQALVVTTLGTKEDEQMIDSLEGVSFKNFLLHYNFPAFSVGEARPPRGPGRREIGHGFLAEKGLTSLLPTREEFPYTIRVVSEILESNGSSSMATVCGGSLSMMDAGVPLKEAAAGIAMGLIYEDDRTAVLSDILGDEDHLGDMDFKVVGTQNGITALQMDIKVTGINRSIIETALDQAKEGRLHILKVMKGEISSSREGLSNYAPRFVTHKIPVDKIRDIIGPGGKVIKGITEKTGAKINVNDDGIISVVSTNHQAVDDALQMIYDLTRAAEIGTVYDATVIKIVDFGAFVEIFPGTQGLVHISNLAKERVKNVKDVLKEGQEIQVKAIGFDRRGKLQLSIKDV